MCRGERSMSVEQAPDWTGVVDRATPPTLGEIVQELADAREIPGDDARDTVESAIDDGVLVEDDGEGMFPRLTVHENGQDDAVIGEDDRGSQGANDGSSPKDAALAAFKDAVEYYSDQLHRELPDVIDAGTPWEYYTETRGWTAETIDEKQLGYAPAGNGLLDYLMKQGYDRDAILGTGLFHPSLEPRWDGRFFFPYKDAEGVVCYAISRSLNHHEDGHPDDAKGFQKYMKATKTKDYSHVDEPIFGLNTVRDGEPVLVAGGIADAITLQQEGYPCISPVTTVQFKNRHKDTVVDLVDEHDVPAVYIINDNERPSIDVRDHDDPVDSIGDVMMIMQYGEGLRGAFNNADFLLHEGIDVRFVSLPRANRSVRKTDPDDFVQE